MKFFSHIYPQKSGVSKNVQNYKKLPIHQNFQSLKNHNSNGYLWQLCYFCSDEFTGGVYRAITRPAAR